MQGRGWGRRGIVGRPCLQDSFKRCGGVELGDDAKRGFMRVRAAFAGTSAPKMRRKVRLRAADYSCYSAKVTLVIYNNEYSRE